jgi:hypothetical protein
MQETVDLILENVSKPSKYESLYKKYSSRKFLKAAIFVEGWVSNSSE